MLKLILLLVSSVCAYQIKTWTWGDFELTSICDLEVKGGSMSQFFLDGPFGDPVPTEILYPELKRIGYTMQDDPVVWTVPINTMYIKNNANGEEYIIDTGLGPNVSRGASEFAGALKSLNISTLDIDYLFLTHAHADHSGGVMQLDYTPLFPNATLVMGRDDYYLFTSEHPDWDDFCCPELLNGDISWVKRALQWYDSPQSQGLILLNASNSFEFNMIDNLMIEMSPGHTTDNHMTIRLTSSDTQRNFYVLGDSFVSGYHMENRTIGCSHDHHRIEAMKTRLEYAQSFDSEDVLFAMHWAFPGTGFFNGTRFNYLNQTEIDFML